MCVQAYGWSPIHTAPCCLSLCSRCVRCCNTVKGSGVSDNTKLSACACSGARLRTQSTVVLFWSRVAAQRQQQPQTHRCGCTVRWTTGHLCCVALVRLLFHRLAFAMVRCSAARTWSVAACVRICCCISQLQLHAHLCCNVISLAPIQLRN